MYLTFTQSKNGCQLQPFLSCSSISKLENIYLVLDNSFLNISMWFVFYSSFDLNGYKDCLEYEHCLIKKFVLNSKSELLISYPSINLFKKDAAAAALNLDALEIRKGRKRDVLLHIPPKMLNISKNVQFWGPYLSSKYFSCVPLNSSRQVASFKWLFLSDQKSGKYSQNSKKMIK